MALPSGAGPASLQERWAAAPPRTRTAARVGLLLAVVLVAYHYSLLSLLRSLGLDTPLAYVGLTPVIALVLAAARATPRRPEPSIHDRQLDYLVGLPLLAVALVVNLVFPHRLSTMFWVWRMDMFSLPFFVAGAVAVLFGVRAMWRMRLAVGFLFLAWPLPFQVLLLRFLTRSTGVTQGALRVAVRVLGVARPVASSDGSMFEVAHHGERFAVSVVSACSGVNGMVGFLLVGIAFAAVVRGPRLRKAMWLSGGMLLLWAVNVGRILLIFVCGRLWGEHTAIQVFHPFIGLVTFNVGVAVMVLTLRPFGLGLGVGPSPPAAGGGAARAALRAVPRVGAALPLVALVAAPLTVANSRLRSYDIVANAVGTPKLASFSSFPATPDGWRVEKSAEYDWARPYFGASSTWLRYTMFPGAGGLALSSDQAVTADVISTSNLRSFSAYGVEACYRFHGYKLRGISSVALGGGVDGQALSFYNGRQRQLWTVVYWIWPVRHGEAVRYERVTLYIQGTAGTTFDGRTLAAAAPGPRATDADAVDRHVEQVRSFLVRFARQVVRTQATVEPGTTLPPSTPALPPLLAQAPWLQRPPPAADATG